MRKFKGRTVFQGNNVKDEAADVALFAELGSSPANMEAGESIGCLWLHAGGTGHHKVMASKLTPKR